MFNKIAKKRLSFKTPLSLRGVGRGVLPLFLGLCLLLGAAGSAGAISPIEGTWGAAALQYDNFNSIWYTEASRITFNANGTGTIMGVKNDGVNTAGQRIKQFTEAFTYTVIPNADGSFNLSLNFSGDIKNKRLVLSDNGNMAIIDGTADPAWEKLNVLAKIDTTKTYSNADLTGEYYSLGFERNVDGLTDPPNGNGSYMAISSIHNFSGTTNGQGMGTYTYVGKANSVYTNGSNGVWDDNGGGAVRYYAVSTNGGMAGGGGAFQGAITGNGKIFGGTGSYASNNWMAYFFMKKGDKTYATADLAGKWAVVGFGQDNKTTPTPSVTFAAEIGTITCDNAGACSFKFKRRMSDGNIGVDTGNAQFSVAADGSFGGSLTNGAPAYAGAIGNDGNTIAFNVSFDSSQIYHREIFIGVRANNIGDLAGTAATIAFNGSVKTVPNWPSTAGITAIAGTSVSAYSPSSSTPISTASVDATTGAVSVTGIPMATTFYLLVQPPAGYMPVLSKLMNWTADIQALLPFALFTQDQYTNTLQNPAGTGMIIGRVTLQSSPTTFLPGATVVAREWIPGAPPTLGATYPVTYTSGLSTQADGIYMVKNVPSGKLVQLTATLGGYTFDFNDAVIPVQTGVISEESFFAATLKGDLDGNVLVNLADAIIAMKVLSGLTPTIRENYATSGTDVNNDGMVGSAEAIYILQFVAGLRQ